MPTPAQEAFAEGFAALSEVHATAWTFGGDEFVAVEVSLKPDDPRMLGGSDRSLFLEVSPDELPSPSPKGGDELERDSVVYRVTKNGKYNAATCRWLFELTTP